jgi:hypothetical protein
VVPIYSVSADNVVAYTRSSTFASLFKTEQSLTYSFTEDGTLVSNWKRSQSVSTSQYILPYTLPVFRMYDLAYVIAPINVYSVSPDTSCLYTVNQTASSTYKQYAVSGIQWNRGACH